MPGAHKALSGLWPPRGGSRWLLRSGEGSPSQDLGLQPISEPAPTLLRSLHLSPSSLNHRQWLHLSPDFPFVLKGRSDDCQIQSSDLDLGICLFLLQANFYSLSHQAKRENHHCKDKSLPNHEHFALPMPQALFYWNIFSQLLFFLPSPPLFWLLQGFPPFPILA